MCHVYMYLRWEQVQQYWKKSYTEMKDRRDNQSSNFCLPLSMYGDLGSGGKVIWSGYNAPSLFRKLQKWSLNNMWSDLPYYYMTTPLDCYVGWALEKIIKTCFNCICGHTQWKICGPVWFPYSCAVAQTKCLLTSNIGLPCRCTCYRYKIKCLWMFWCFLQWNPSLF